MLNDIEQIARLTDRIGAERLPQVVARLLRVPQAWAHLRAPEVLEAALAAPKLEGLTPDALALQALGLEAWPVERSMEPEAEAELQSLATFEPGAGRVAGDLRSVALHAVSLMRLARDEGIPAVVERVMQSPVRWRSPLACAWPRLSEPGRLLRTLVQCGSEGVTLAAHILLSNADACEAAQVLSPACSGLGLDPVRILELAGETTLAAALGRHLLEHAPETPPTDRHTLAAGLVRRATISRLEGADAVEALEQAWEASSEQAAEVADQMAQAASAQGDPVLALEARQQAVRLHPTPQRRAHWALACLDCGQEPQALQALSPQAHSAEEWIAAGHIHLRRGGLGEAVRCLEEALSLGEIGPGLLVAPWDALLTQGLTACGRLDLALTQTQARVAARPADAKLRFDHARLLSDAGDPQAAACQTSLALALSPTLQAARRVLAESLESVGAVEAARRLWRELETEDPASRLGLARCALAAGDISEAEERSRRLLDDDPGLSTARVLLAQSLSQAGRREDGLACLTAGLETEPQDEELWIGLATLQASAEGSDTVESVLQRGVQEAPGSSRLRVALARHLRANGRLSEALAAAQQAVALQSGDPAVRLELGQILRLLRRSEEALPLLRSVLARRPRDYAARMALAEVLEDLSHFVEAAQLAEAVPDDASVADRLLAGRILVQGVEAGAHADALQRAVHLLSGLHQTDPGHGQGLFWLARAYEMQGDPATALETFQASRSRLDGPDDPLHLPAGLGAARAAQSVGQPDLAMALLEEARARFPESPAVWVALSQVYRSASRFEDAIAAAEQAIALDPGSPVGWEMLARAGEQARDWPSASRGLLELFALRPDDPEVALDLAEVARRLGDLPRAREALARALWTGRGSADVLIRAASFFSRIDRARSAQRALRLAMRRANPQPAWLRQLAKASEHCNDPDTAARAWLACAEHEPHNPEPLYRAAQALDSLGRWPQAQQTWRQAVDVAPQRAELQTGLARSFRKSGQVLQALNEYTRALQAHPEDADIALEAGQAAMDHGVMEEALELLYKAGRMAPTRADIRTAQAECLLRLNRPDESRQRIEETSPSIPPTARSHSILALACAEGGDFSSANEAFETARKAPAAPADALYLSKAALRLGRWTEAQQALDAATSTAESSIQATLHAARAETRLLTLAAGWLYGQVQAHVHASQIGLPSPDTREEIAGLLRQAESSGAPPETVAALHKATRAVHGQASHEDLEALYRMRRDSDGGVLEAAWAVGAARSTSIDALSEAPDPRTTSGLAATLLASGLSRAGKPDQVGQLLEIAAREPAFHAPAAYLAARRALADSELEPAIESLNIAVAAWPEEPRWHHELASLYLQTGAIAAAIPHLQQVCEADPDDADAALSLGRALRDSGQLAEAKQAYRHATDLLPSLTPVWKEAGQVALALGHAHDAEAWYERACTLSPSDPLALIGAARAALALGKPQQAAERARSATRLAPEDPNVLLGLGEILESQGKTQAALAAFDKALTLATHPVPIQVAKSRMLAHLGRASEGAADLHKSLQDSSDDDQAWATLAELYESSKDMNAAMEAAAQAVRIAPRRPEHHLLLGRLARKTGHLDRALDELRQTEALGLSTLDVLLDLGKTYEERREYDLALDAFNRAITAQRESSEAHFHAGVVLKRMKAYRQAGRMLEQAVDLNPKDAEAHHQLAAVRALELVHGGLQQVAVQP